MLDKNSKIYIAGHHGLVGSAIWNNLEKRGYHNLVGRSHKELDLTDQYAVEKFFDEEKPDAVVLAAAFVGGIMANSLYRADFIMQNMKMQCNVISNAYSHGVKKLLFLGSTCIYPKNAPQPMSEDVLLTSPLEYTNEEYAIAKIAGLKMCESYNLQYGTNYIAVMPTNLYGLAIMPPTKAAAKTTASGCSSSKNRFTACWSVKSSSRCVRPTKLWYPLLSRLFQMADPTKPR